MPSVSHAQEAQQTPNQVYDHLGEDPVTKRREALKALAEKFTKKIAPKMEEAEFLLSNDGNTEAYRYRPAFEGLLEDETMIMQVSLYYKDPRKTQAALILPNPVIGYKRGYDIMISLVDMINVAAFPIKIDETEKTAKGWFIQESNTFSLDLNKKTLSIGDKDLPFPVKDIEYRDGDILVKGQTLADWFKFDLVVNPQGQKMKVYTYEPWPIQQRNERALRQQSISKQRQPASEPFQEEPYKLASVPALDVSLFQEVSKLGNGTSRTSTSYNISGTGDLLGHSMDLSATGGTENAINNVYLNLSKESKDPNLLGPLQARFYEFNDITPTRIPLAGTSPTERGFHVSNKGRGFTFDTSTLIDGVAPPGWDVELYRDQIYLQGTATLEDGYYSFEDVKLYGGDNNFYVILYGPQGEMRVEEKKITVSNDMVNNGRGFYDVSISQQNENTYRANPSNDPDKGTPHLSALYEHSINDAITGRVGLRTLQQQKDLSIYTYAGLVGIWENYILNQDFLVTDRGAYSTASTARRLFGRHSLAARTEYRSEDFTTEPTGTNQNIPQSYRATFSATGPFAEKYRKGMRYDADFGLFLRGEDKSAQTSFAVSSRLNGLLVNKGLSYQRNFGNLAGTNYDPNEMKGFLNVRGRHRETGVSWHSKFNYDLLPDVQPDRFNLNLSKNFDEGFNGQVTLDHDFDTSFTSLSSSLNIIKEKYMLSPTITVDSDSNFRALVNLRFGVMYDPHTNDVAMRGVSLGNYGGVSAFVFLDKDGNGIYDGEDEELQDVVVESVQSPNIAVSNAEGQALLNNLPSGRVTDVKVQEGSSFETNWLSGASGVSVRPRPGIISRVDFPILRGGEIDGTVYVTKPGGGRVEASNVILYLNHPSGERILQSFTAYDGFYVFERVRPGIYYLTADTSRASFTGYIPPVKVIVSVNGDVFYGKDMTLKRGFDIPYTFSAVNEAPSSKRNARVETLDDIAGQAVLLKIGPYKTDIMKMLSWYKIKLKYGNLIQGLKRVEDQREKEGEESFITLQPEKAGFTVEMASLVCETFASEDIDCGVEIVTVYKTPEMYNKTASLN